MVDALLVFSPLQEICFFVLRSSYLDQIGVAPLLRRRLLGLQSFFDFVGLSKYVSSHRLLLGSCSLHLAVPSTFHPQFSLLSAFQLWHRALLSFVRSVATYIPIERLVFTCFTP